MNKTKIEWVKNPDGTQGYTWNPITGCLNGCPYCYARKLANGRLRSRYLANTNIARSGYPIPKNLNELPMDEDDPFYPRFWEGRLEDPLWIKKPCGIFVCDMGELFGDWIPIQWQRLIFWTIKSCPQHRFYLLTKQPQNLIKWSPFPDNCWVGVTATDVQSYREARRYLKHIEAKVKYISFEPLLEHIPVSMIGLKYDATVDWVIIGAQTKPYKPPEIEWVREISEACDKAGIPVFLKDNLYKLIISTPLEQCTGFWVEGFKLRQEMPRLVR